MEQDLMEKLLTDFNGTLRDINELIKNNDVDGVRQTPEEISEIVSERNNIPLNSIEGNEYDNVLHELLDKLDGVVEAKGENVTSEIDEISEKKISELINDLTNIHSEEVAEIEKEIANLKHRREEAEESIKNERSDSAFVKNVRADLEKIDKYLEENQNKLDEINKNSENNPNKDDIEFLKTFISNEDITINQAIIDLEKAKESFEKEIANLKHRQEEAEESIKNEHNDSTFAKNVRADLEKINDYLEKNQSKLDEINNKISKIKDISGISKMKSDVTPEQTTTDKINIKEEAQKIGDNIFKTARIRRELYDRDISRDDFLRFYEIGINETKEQLDELIKYKGEIDREIEMITVDYYSDKSLIQQIEEAEQAEIPDQKLIIELYEGLRQNFISAGRREQLENIGLDHAVATEEDVELMKKIFSMYKQWINGCLDEINIQAQDLKENIDIFNREIDIINKEKETLDVLENSKAEYIENIEKSIEIRKALLEISMAPEKKLTEEQRELLNNWQETSEKFLLEKRKTGELTYVDRTGETKTINVESIDDSYPEYKKDIELLGVPRYKENLEQINAYIQVRDPYVFGEEVGKTYDALEANKKGAGEAYIAKIARDKQNYVETFNGIPNFYKLRYENLKTAGSTLKSMKPVGKDLPLATRAKNSVENIGRFFGIRAPKFTKFDDHGNEVRDIKGGIATLAIDAAVVGAVAVSAVAVGPGLAVAGYVAKGMVVAGNKVAARVVYRRHKDEIDNNLPTLNQTDATTREEARKAYYREKGNNRFVAWVKAKSDKYVTRNRGKETEKAIVLEKQEEFEKSSMEIIEKFEEDSNKLKANQKARVDRTKQQVERASTYNDIIREPDSVDIDEAIKTIANNAVINSEKSGKGDNDVNKTSKMAKKNQYIDKEDGTFAKTQELSGAVSEKVDGEVSAITEAQKNQAVKRKIDNANRVATVILTTGIKTAITAWKEGFTKEVTETVHHDAEYETESVYQEPIYEDVEITDYSEVPNTDLTLQELINQKSGETFDRYYSVYGGLKGQEEVILNSNQKITSVWVGDDSLIGSGISDTSGLTAPVLTDKTAPDILLDSSGILRQDITIQELLDAANGDISNLENVYVNISDQGWMKMSDLMDGITKQVSTGTHIESQLVEEGKFITKEVLVKEAYDEVKTTNVFSKAEVGKTVLEGALGGAGVAMANDAHEAVQTTYNNSHTPGNPKESMPYAYSTEIEEQEKTAETEGKETSQSENDKKDLFTKISKKKQKEANKEREKREEQQKQEEQEQDDGDR